MADIVQCIVCEGRGQLLLVGTWQWRRCLACDGSGYWAKQTRQTSQPIPSQAPLEGEVHGE